MKLPRRRFLHLAAGATALPATSRFARAQAFPSRPITMVVAFAAGGSTDVIGRILAERMGRSLGQTVIIENVSGANGTIGTGRAARARPDGYTISLGPMDTYVLNGAFYSLPYDVLNDFTPISPIAAFPLFLYARKTVPAHDLRELIAWLRANSKASVGFGIVSYRLLAAFFERETKTQLTLVPYRGTAPTMEDLIAGQIDLSFNTPDQLPLVRAGSIKAYAVTGDRRVALMPDIPTFRELGLPSLSFSDWFGLFAPRGTPTEVVTKLNASVVDALGDPTVQSRLVELGQELFPRERQIRDALGEMAKADAERGGRSSGNWESGRSNREDRSKAAFQLRSD
jgi:tripartite-type tricarboxylate transporter receptor subunit TctC